MSGGQGFEVVYAFQAESGGPLKIGRSTNLRMRLSVTQSYHHEKIRCVALWHSAQMHAQFLEEAIHRVLAPWRLHGEWFDLGGHGVLPEIDVPARLREIALSGESKA